jgi:hypothetical protein
VQFDAELLGTSLAQKVSHGAAQPSLVRKKTKVLQKNVSVLGLRPVARVRIHDQLRVGKMLGKEKGINRHDNDVL